MSKIPLIARILLGAAFVFFGLNSLLHFLPQPPMTGPSGDFINALVNSGYMIPLMGVTEIAGGVLVLSGRMTPLGLVLLAPVLVNIILFHAVLAPAGIALGLVLTALEIYLAYAYRAAFRPLMNASV